MMPRIAREPDPDNTTYQERLAFHQLLQRNGSGSSIFDVCTSCVDAFGGDGAPWPEDPLLAPYNGEHALNIACVIFDCGDHPSYDEDDDYCCAVCSAPLTDREDG